jgi:hypothetical protein
MVTVEIEQRTCEHCGGRFTPRRSDARFCPGRSRCRTAAYRARLLAAAQPGTDRMARLRRALERVTISTKETSP